MIVILFTHSYPYDVAVEQTFLDPEIEVLSRNFDQIIIVPEIAEGNRASLPGNVEVATSLATFENSFAAKLRYSFKALLSSLFSQELRNHPSLIYQPDLLKLLLLYLKKAVKIQLWFNEFMVQRRLEQSDTVLYTYWLGYCSTGLSLAKNTYNKIKLVSRTHRSDLYENEMNAAYIPCRGQTLEKLDGLFPDSNAGREYIVERYPWFTPRCELSRMGVCDPGFVTKRSTDGISRIVSCSFLIPRKRIDLLLSGIEMTARMHPDKIFEWNHIGDGPLRKMIEDRATEILPQNVTFHVRGYLPPHKMMTFYKDNPIDVFVNVSDSEGTPVSLMEAASCCIPIIATAVGGNVEIVSDKNGVLLEGDPSSKQVAHAILHILKNPSVADQMRKESYYVWRRKYHASQNYQNFANCLKYIRKPSSSSVQ